MASRRPRSPFEDAGESSEPKRSHVLVAVPADVVPAADAAAFSAAVPASPPSDLPPPARDSAAAARPRPDLGADVAPAPGFVAVQRVQPARGGRPLRDIQPLANGWRRLPNCQCGHCVEDTRVARRIMIVKGKERRPLCCMQVVTDEVQRGATGLVCQAPVYKAIVQQGADQVAYDEFKDRIKDVPCPLTFADCNNAQKRVIVYAVLHNQLAEQDGWDDVPEMRGVPWKTMPECLKLAVRQRWPDPVRVPGRGRDESGGGFGSLL